MKKEIEEMQGYLVKVGAFLSKVKFKLHELEAQTVSEELDRFLDTFTAQSRSNVDLKLNIEQNCELWTVAEKNEMPFLKDLKYRRLKNGVHQFRYRRNGFDESFSSKDLKTAKNKAKAFIAELKKKSQDNKTAKNLCQLNYVAELWFKNKKCHVADATWRSYESVYKNHIAPRFGARNVKNILPMDLQPFFNNFSTSLGKTGENAKIILNGIFEFAVANRFCNTNPMPGVIVEKHIRKTGKALTDEQIKRFKETMLSLGGFGTAYLIILFSGIRGAELEKMSFDFEQGTFTVDNAKLKKHQRVIESNLKRTVPIFPDLLEIRERIERNDWRYKAKSISDNLSRVWCESSTKDLRHTFITKARQSGVENELVNLWTGHLSLGNNVTANVYTHFDIDFQKAQAQKVRI